MNKLNLKSRYLSIVAASSFAVGSVTTAIADEVDREVAAYLGKSYPAATVFMHQVAKDVPIDKVVNAAVKYDPARKQEFVDLAERLLPSLPEQACAPAEHNPINAQSFYDQFDLSSQTVGEVARRYFERGEILAALSEGAHLSVPTAELVSLLQTGDHWYSVLPSIDDHPVQEPIFLSLYKDSKQVSVDTNLGKLAAAQAAGKKTLKVAFLYNESNQIPVGKFSDLVAGTQVLQAYVLRREEVTQVPSSVDGDFHTFFNLEELQDIADNIPNVDFIDQGLRAALEADFIDNGYESPVLVKVRNDIGEVDVIPAEKVAVAANLGANDIPVIFAYENRQSDQSSLDCIRLISQAADDVVQSEILALGTGFPQGIFPQGQVTVGGLSTNSSSAAVSSNNIIFSQDPVPVAPPFCPPPPPVCPPPPGPPPPFIPPFPIYPRAGGVI